MDAIITYVNGLDTDWLEKYHSVSKFVNEKRYRDWGTLRYVLRGIALYLPYIKNVYLAVSSKSQVPDYVNTNEVKIIYHDEFIPNKFLPTFNSNTIESFLFKIPGLSEKFIYFNDDTIPIKRLQEDCFFESGLPCYMNNSYDLSEDIGKTMFYDILCNCNNLAKFAVSVKEFSGNTSLFFTQHTATPFLKSDCMECYNKTRTFIDYSVTRFRDRKNMSQFLYSAYSYYKGNSILKDIPYGYVSIGDKKYSKLDVYNLVKSDKFSSICINDHSTNLNDDIVNEYQILINDCLSEIMPTKGKYEN